MKEVIIKLNGIVYSKCDRNIMDFKYVLKKEYSFHTKIRPKKVIYLTSVFGDITIRTTGRCIINKFTLWNGSDYVPDTDSSMRASLEHDMFCRLYNKGLLSKKWIPVINDRYKTTCKNDGMSWIVYNIRRAGLKIYWSMKA